MEEEKAKISAEDVQKHYDENKENYKVPELPDGGVTAPPSEPATPLESNDPQTPPANSGDAPAAETPPTATEAPANPETPATPETPPSDDGARARPKRRILNLLLRTSLPRRATKCRRVKRRPPRPKRVANAGSPPTPPSGAADWRRRTGRRATGSPRSTGCGERRGHACDGNSPRGAGSPGTGHDRAGRRARNFPTRRDCGRRGPNAPPSEPAKTEAAAGRQKGSAVSTAG